MSLDLVKIGCNIAGAGITISMFGMAPKSMNASDIFYFGGLYVSLLAGLYRMNVR